MRKGMSGRSGFGWVSAFEAAQTSQLQASAWREDEPQVMHSSVC